MLNMDLTQRVVIRTHDTPWAPSPAPGVLRRKLAREERELGHATSVVKYEAGARFSTHPHPRGEEILVLEGTFSDETGDYGPGTYIRNPEGFVHAPYSDEGCTLFVKLHQFLDGDNVRVCIDTRKERWQPGHGGLQVMPLYESSDDKRSESAALVHWPKNEQFAPHRHHGGEEILVLKGEFKDEHGAYPAGTWLRNPDQSTHHPYVEQETMIFVKIGHLPFVD